MSSHAQSSFFCIETRIILSAACSAVQVTELESVLESKNRCAALKKLRAAL
jgi:hypothetical protein